MNHGSEVKHQRAKALGTPLDGQSDLE